MHRLDLKWLQELKTSLTRHSAYYAPEHSVNPDLGWLLTEFYAEVLELHLTKD